MHGKLQQVVRIYGIRNCDSMKKAFVWLAEHAVACDFVDYRQAAPTAAQLADWNLRVGWKALLNTRGTTWRRLGEEDRADVDEARALTLMARHPSLIRRPVIDTGTALLVGFDPDRYAEELLGKGP
ncbi:MAG: arsenate reductase [Candidatus Accumulibacter sp.]|jgi:arsenate reductase|uniref:arsenate reductase n=1 Tax=Accumulibacter sp. TaxID=2053492 RepID=UPI001AD42898|nr:arsenate reductase [Accumulibacter sp.]MBK8115133.1 arsenate reductase [Accumulibacter sp.]MBK8385675.1 arsenate reductase [Accumulibacter sp.]MBK8580218.1 arsenate reductase [Candidatus Accumulibacter propinquus]MBN8439484.1 arsenate reductase [Accumulibacter sp.]